LIAVLIYSPNSNNLNNFIAKLRSLKMAEETNKDLIRIKKRHFQNFKAAQPFPKRKHSRYYFAIVCFTALINHTRPSAQKRLNKT